MQALDGDWTAGEGRRDLPLLFAALHLEAAAGSNPSPPTPSRVISHYFPRQPQGAQWLGAEDRAVNEVEMAPILKALKTQQGEATEQIRKCDHCHEDVQVPLRARPRRSWE